MKILPQSLLALAPLMAAGIACGPKEPIGGLPYSAEVLTLAERSSTQSIDDPTPYVLKKVTFPYLENIDSLTSKYFNFRSGGEVVVRGYETGDKITLTTDHNRVSPPSLYYNVKDGVVIPGDSFTLYALSCAYQFDFFLSKLETISGISPDELTKTKGKFTIYFNTVFKEIQGSRTSTMSTHNASYLGLDYSFLTFRPVQEEIIPLSSNLKVIAHEAGHLLFHYLTSDGFSNHENLESIRYTEDEALIGLNEGFADLTSFTITGISDILGDTSHLWKNPSLRNFRRTHFNESSLEGCGNSEPRYCYGILFANAYARSLSHLGVDLESETNRIQYYKQIISAIKSASSIIKTRKLALNNFLRPHAPFKDFITTLASQIEDQSFRDEFTTQIRRNFPQTLR